MKEKRILTTWFRILGWIMVFLAIASAVVLFATGHHKAGWFAVLTALFKLEAIFWHHEMEFEASRFEEFRKSIENPKRQDRPEDPEKDSSGKQ